MKIDSTQLESGSSAFHPWACLLGFHSFSPAGLQRCFLSARIADPHWSTVGWEVHGDDDCFPCEGDPPSAVAP